MASGISIKGRALTLQTADEAQEVVKLIQASPNATSIQLSGNSLGVEAIRAISEALESNTTLVDADFSDIFTRRVRSEIPPSVSLLIGCLKNKPNLEILNFSDNAFGPDGVTAFIDFMVSNTHLKTLNINNTGLGPEGGRLVAAGLRGKALQPKEGQEGKPCALEVLIAGRSRLENPGASALAASIQEMGTLKTLSIPQSGITPDGMIALAHGLGFNPNLEVLDLYDNNIGKKGAPAIVRALEKLPKLKKVNLGDCMIGTKGADQIIETLKNLTALEELDLSFNSVKDESVPGLLQLIKNNPNLRTLELNGNYFSNVKKIKSALKDIERHEILGTLSDNDSEGSEEGSGSGSEEKKGSEESESGSGDDEEMTKEMGKLKI